MSGPDGGNGGDLLLAACERVLELVGDRAEAEVAVSTGRSALTRFANSFIHQNVAENGQWARLKVVVGGRQATAGTTRLSTGLDDLVARALEAAALRPVDPDWPGLAPSAPVPPQHPSTYDPDTHFATPAQRAEIVRRFVDQGEGLTAAGFCEAEGHEVAFANSAGQRASGRTTRATVEGIHRLGTADGGAQQVSASIAALEGEAMGRIAAGKARRSADAVEVEPGPWEVVLEPNCVSDVLGFLAGQGFNAKQHAEGQSFVELGRAQLDPKVTIVDDATDPRLIGLPFDAEGTPRRRLELVRAGVSVNLAHDRRTSSRRIT